MDQSLLQLSTGYLPAQILYAAADLGIADVLADRPLSSGVVAEKAGADPSAILRLLRALVGLGVVAQRDTDLFALTDLGGQLRTGTQDSIRDNILLCTMPQLWHAWGELATAVRTGKPVRDRDAGRTAFESTMRHPELARLYRAAKAQSSLEFTGSVTKVYDFTGFGLVADLGGDCGTFMAAALSAAPEVRGVVYDTPQAHEQIAATLREAAVADRCEIAEGDVTVSVAPGADAYLLNHVLRDMDDEHAVEVLRNCRAATAPGSRVLVVETVIPVVLSPEDSPAYGMTDLNNLVYAGGRERTADEYRELLWAGGFTVTGMTNAASTEGLPDYQLIEGVPSD